MTIQCSFCGGIRNTIKFKAGYVCEECLDYIRKSDHLPGRERSSRSNGNVNGSEKTEKKELTSGKISNQSKSQK